MKAKIGMAFTAKALIGGRSRLRRPQCQSDKKCGRSLQPLATAGRSGHGSKQGGRNEAFVRWSWAKEGYEAQPARIAGVRWKGKEASVGVGVGVAIMMVAGAWMTARPQKAKGKSRGDTAVADAGSSPASPSDEEEQEEGRQLPEWEREEPEMATIEYAKADSQDWSIAEESRRAELQPAVQEEAWCECAERVVKPDGAILFDFTCTCGGLRVRSSRPSRGQQA